jgi:hypothetical protein
VSLDKRLMAVAIESSTAEFVHGVANALIDSVRGAESERTHHGSPYAVTADGERFVIARPVDATRPVSVVLNWPELLEHSQP